MRPGPKPRPIPERSCVGCGCAVKRSAADYVANKDRHRVTQRRCKLRTYGLTPEDYEAMRTDQGGLCAMCGSPPSAENLDVDHCHETGAVRGLLWCNRVIGQAGDDPALLKLGINYLEAHRAVE